MRTIGDIRIYHWTELQDSFKGSDIFLGNGFSININNSLNYNSLFNRFLTYLDQSEQSIFRKFNTTNFEGIQGKLVDTSHVNQIFGLENIRIIDAIKKLKMGLIGAVKELHPTHAQIDPNTIFQLSQKLDWFGNIFTTNYDMFLYYITLATLDRARKDNSIQKYQDFFRNDHGQLIFNGEQLPGYKSIYYLHGALIIRKQDQSIVKIMRGSRNEDLLELIKLQVHLGYLPIFVSEGRAALKAETISRNSYLTFCQDAFANARKSLVIYGFSFSLCDEHLTSILNSCKRKLAIGIYMKGSTESQVQKHVREIEEKLFAYRLSEIRYFDSSSLF